MLPEACARNARGSRPRSGFPRQSHQSRTPEEHQNEAASIDSGASLPRKTESHSPRLNGHPTARKSSAEDRITLTEVSRPRLFWLCGGQQGSDYESRSLHTTESITVWASAAKSSKSSKSEYAATVTVSPPTSMIQNRQTSPTRKPISQELRFEKKNPGSSSGVKASKLSVWAPPTSVGTGSVGSGDLRFPARHRS